jgi:hypothetical protein
MTMTNSKFFWQVAIASVICVLSVTAIVSATTTVGTGLTTSGTLTAYGPVNIGGAITATSTATFAGNVGIGTTTQSDKLYVSSTGSTRIGIDSTNSSADVGINLLSTGIGKWQIYNDENGNFNINNTFNPNLFINRTTGNVGIGTTSPQTNLHIFDNDNNVSLTLEGYNPMIRFSSGLADVGNKNWAMYAYLNTFRGTIAEDGWANGDTTWLEVQRSGQYNVTKVNFPNGNVGIGTTTPQFKLDVNGDVNISAGSIFKINGVKMLVASTTLDNYFFGEAGNLTMTGSVNSANGANALFSNTTGSYNTANGGQSLALNISGSNNTAYGVSSLFSNTTGLNNTAFGSYALSANVTGNYNTALGDNAGMNSLGGSNVFIGHESGYNEIGSNKLYISNSITNNLIYGDFSTGKVSIGTTTAPSTLDVYSHTATSTLQVDSGTGEKGACLKMKDSDGVGYTYVTFNNGTMTATTSPCD